MQVIYNQFNASVLRPFENIAFHHNLKRNLTPQKVNESLTF